MTSAPPEQPVGDSINLKDPVIAGVLAWLVPGLGHWYQGRRAKAVLYFVCIIGMFVVGLYLSSSNEKCVDGPGTIGYGRAVYCSWRPGDHRLHYLCQVCVGLPALPALLQASRMANGRPVWWDGLMAPPRLSRESRADDPNRDQPTPNDLNLLLNRDFELAGFFTMVAGLLNILAIYDAVAGPVASQPAPKKEETEAPT